MNDREREVMYQLVSNRSDPTLFVDGPMVSGGIAEMPCRCPRCGSSNLQRGGVVTTLVGGFRNDLLSGDPNHTWQDNTCLGCELKFTLETKEGEAWITVDRVVLRGFPACFEDYVYTCSACEGDVYRRVIDKRTGQDATSIMYDASGCSAFHRYECRECHRFVEAYEI